MNTINRKAGSLFVAFLVIVGFFPIPAHAMVIGFDVIPGAPVYTVGENVSIELNGDAVFTGADMNNNAPTSGYYVDTGDSLPSALSLDTSVPTVRGSGAAYDNRYITGTAQAVGSFNIQISINAQTAGKLSKPFTLLILDYSSAITAPSIDYENETLTGLVAGNYSFAGQNGAIVAITGNHAIDSAWPGTTLSIVKKGDRTTVGDSTPLSFAVPARPVAPAGLSAVNETLAGNNDGKITGVSTAMEWSADGTNWTVCTGTEVTGLAAGNYQVRVAASNTNSTFYGAAAMVTIGSNTPATDKSIASFTIPGGTTTISGTSITVTMPAGADLTSLVPTITHTGMSVSPGDGVAVDFSQGSVKYTVTAADGSTQDYTITVKLKQSGGGGSSDDWEPVEDIKSYEQAIVIKCREWANVRSGPSTDHEIVGQVYLGETIELLQWNKDETWCKILYNGGNNLGWLYYKFIKPVK